MWKNGRHLQEVYCPFLKLRFLRDCRQNFSSISNPEHEALFSGYTSPPHEGGREGMVVVVFLFCKKAMGKKCNNGLFLSSWQFAIEAQSQDMRIHCLSEDSNLNHHYMIWLFWVQEVVLLSRKEYKNHVARRKNKWWHDCLSCKSTYLEQNKAKQLCIRFLTPKLLLSLYHSKHLISVLTYMLEGLSLLHSHLQLLIFQECKTLLRITAFQDTICPPTNNDFYSLFLALWPCIWLH